MKKIEPSLRALRLLAAVAGEAKLKKAARRVGISQSAASHAVRELEANLGAALFVREPSGLRLSDTGTRLLPHVRRLLDALDAIRAEISGLAQLQTGSLRIAATPTLAATIVPRLIAQYHALYPGIEVSLFEGTDDEVRDWVVTGVTQVGFSAIPVAGVRCTELTQDEWLALVPAKAFPGRQKIGLATLSRRNVLLSGGGCDTHIRRMFEQAGVDLCEHRTVKELATIQAMVAEELGVSLVPSINMRVAPKGTRSLPLAPRRFRRIGMLQPLDDAPPSPLVDAWVTLTTNRFTSADSRRTRPPVPNRPDGFVARRAK